MNLREIVKDLKLEIITKDSDLSLDNKVNGVYIGDLLSLVIAKAKCGDLWVTIQTHLNIVAVASLVELSAIIIAEDMEIDKDTIDKANEVNIPLFRSNLSAYELACKLCKLGV